MSFNEVKHFLAVKGLVAVLIDLVKDLRDQAIVDVILLQDGLDIRGDERSGLLHVQRLVLLQAMFLPLAINMFPCLSVSQHACLRL